MLVSAMTCNLGIWLIKIKYTFKKKIKNYKKNVIYAYNYRLNQSGQHNL